MSEAGIDRLLGGSAASPELVAKAASILAQFDLPRSGDDGRLTAGCAAAGCLLVDLMAKMAVSQGLMAPSTGAAVESLVARAIDTWSTLALEVTG